MTTEGLGSMQRAEEVLRARRPSLIRKAVRAQPPKGRQMPRFAANLAYMFTERPLIERFGAAAAAGFKAVELQFPYDHAASGIRAELDRHGLTVLGLNTAEGQ